MEESKTQRQSQTSQPLMEIIRITMNPRGPSEKGAKNKGKAHAQEEKNPRAVSPALAGRGPTILQLEPRLTPDLTSALTAAPTNCEPTTAQLHPAVGPNPPVRALTVRFPSLSDEWSGSAVTVAGDGTPPPRPARGVALLAPADGRGPSSSRLSEG